MLGPVSRLPPHGVGHIQQTDYKRNKPGDEEAPTNTRLRYKQKEDTQTPRRNRTDEPVENYPYTFQPIAYSAPSNTSWVNGSAFFSGQVGGICDMVCSSPALDKKALGVLTHRQHPKPKQGQAAPLALQLSYVVGSRCDLMRRTAA
jgi:hypothetical protein